MWLPACLTAADFEIVLQRIAEKGIGIYGIEPWLNGEFYGAEVFEEHADTPFDATWYQKVFFSFKEAQLPLQYCATYAIPEELLMD